MPGSLVGDMTTSTPTGAEMGITPDRTPPDDRLRPGRPVPRAPRRFLRTEAAGGAVLLVAAVAALVWANSPWRASYVSLWETEVAIRLGDVARSEDLRHVVNEALMALFFLVVGLEIKRELVAGELARWRNAAVPALAALGGMVVPAAIYAAFNRGGPGAGGWAIPMATDIAFALGVVALLGHRVPASLRVFLLTLAIVDDIGAIVVIAVFYSGGVAWPALATAAVLLGAVVGLRALRVGWLPAYAVLGVGVWLAFYESGIHATLAGVVLGLLTPASPLTPATVARDWGLDLSEEPSAGELRDLTATARSTVSTAERLQHGLHPLTSFLVVPLFALANAGVVLRSDALGAPGATAVAAGVGAGLVVGKVLGVSGFTWLAVRLRLGALPEGAGWAQLIGIGAIAGIGFTVSLFVAGLAFPAAGLEGAAKIGILAASLLAAVIGATILATAARSSTNQAQPGERE